MAKDATILHQEAADPTNIVTKAQLRELVQRISHGLRHEHGVGLNGPNKDVVTVMSYGQPLVAAAFFGVIAAGGAGVIGLKAIIIDGRFVSSPHASV